MKSLKSLGCLTFVFVVLLGVSPASAQTDGSACQRLEELKTEAEKRFEQANSSEERQRIESRYEDMIERAEEECRESGNISGEKIEEAPVEKLDESRCRKRAEKIRESFITSFRSLAFDQTGKAVSKFQARKELLISRCSIYSDREEKERMEVPAVQKEEPPELSFTLPEKTGSACRSRVEEMKKKYLEKMKEQGANREQLRKKFYSRVEKKLENCNPGPRIVNVSEAPESMPESCRRKMRKLNQRIRSETGAEVGSRVPEIYRKEYREAMKGCVAGAVKDRIRGEIKQKFTGGVKKLRKKLEEKNERIRELEQKVERLSGKENSESLPQQSGGVEPEKSRKNPEEASGKPGSRQENQGVDPGKTGSSSEGKKPPEKGQGGGIIGSIIGLLG